MATVDTNLQLKTGESPKDYRSRVAAYQASPEYKLPTLDITKTGTTPASVPTPTPNTATAGAQTYIDEFTKNLAQTTADAKTAYDTSKEDFLTAYLKAPTASELKDTAYKASVDPIKKEVDAQTAALAAEQRSNTNRLRAIDKNPTGMLASGLQGEKDRVNNESLQRQADIAVVLAAKNGQYQTAADIADRAVTAQLEQQTKYTNALQMVYQDNKELFTTAEQRQFESAQADRQSKLDEEKQKRLLDYKAKIDAAAASASNSNTGVYGGGPVSIATNADGTASPVSLYSLKAGDDPYLVAQSFGTDMETLKKLNPEIKDWTTLQPGQNINLPDTSNTWLAGKTPAQIQAYNAVPDADKGAIKQLVTGDALLTDIVKSRGKDTQAQINRLISLATSIDPNFSINENKQRYQYKTQFNNPNGKEQLQINAINTGLGHLAEFNSQVKTLGNGGVIPANDLKNYLAKNAGDPNVVKTNIIITALAGELASVYKGGTAPTDQETEEWRNAILTGYSKAQSQGVTDTTSALISNKLLALSNSYKNIIGAYPDAPIVNPDVIQQLIDSGANVSPITDKLKAQGYSVPTGYSQSVVDATLSPYGFSSTGNVNGILSQYGL